MNIKERENGLGTLAVILLIIVPLAMWIIFDFGAAVLTFLFCLLVIATVSVGGGQ